MKRHNAYLLQLGSTVSSSDEEDAGEWTLVGDCACPTAAAEVEASGALF